MGITLSKEETICNDNERKGNKLIKTLAKCIILLK